MHRSLWRRNFRKAGDSARDRQDWPAAIDGYRAHLAVHPEDVAIWIQLGHVNKEEEQFEEALAAYQAAAQSAPDDPDLLLSLGHLFKQMGRFDQALDAYARSAGIAPGLHAGAAMVQIEQILARLVWRTAVHDPLASLPQGVDALLALVDAGEAQGERLFATYFRSFSAR